MLNALDEKMLERKKATRALRQQNAALSTASSIRRTNSLKMSEPYSPLRDFHGSLYHRSTARYGSGLSKLQKYCRLACENTAYLLPLTAGGC